ncbi:hypothetical protein [Tenacibaculum ovolyticum]|uniref:hypothetical protein n=1 Tax=Tenacibaculum ovolyticum TaxID=104270 RepID=UPI00041B6904|nr:hypothetical protein [Tenacibaculum ovolyticum]
MKKNTFLENAKHKQTFHSKGTYCKKNNEIKIATEIPKISLSDSEKTYSLSLKKHDDISSEFIPCMLAVYGHGHPTHRGKIGAGNLDWDRKRFPLSSIFKCTNFPCEKILVITVHDEDFEDWHIAIYRFFVQHHVSFNDDEKNFDYDIKILQDFIAGKSKEIIQQEEPRTVGGGVIDPITTP